MVSVFVFLLVGLAANYAAAAVLPPLDLSEALEAAAVRAPAAPSQITHPMDASAGHAMWDPIGRGCIDGGGWDDPFPTGKGTRAPVFCLPQPCARALTSGELSRDVVGRTLRAGEWKRYVFRYMRACQEDSISDADMKAPLRSLEEMANECAPIGASSSSPITSISSAAGPLGRGQVFLMDEKTIPNRIIQACSTETGGRMPPHSQNPWPEPPGGLFSPPPGTEGPSSPPDFPGEPPIAAPLPPTLFLLIAALIAPSALRHHTLRGGGRIKQPRSPTPG